MPDHAKIESYIAEIETLLAKIRAELAKAPAKKVDYKTLSKL